MKTATTPQRTYRNALVLYYWKQCGPCREFAPVFQKVLDKLTTTSFPATAYLIEVMENRDLLQQYNADLGDGVPRLELYNSKGERQVYDGPRTVKGVKSAVDAFMSPSISGGSTIDSLTVDPTTLPVPSLVMYYSPSCTFCKVFLPIYLQLAAAHESSGVPVLAVNVKTYPDARTHLLANAYSDTVPHVVYHASATKQVPFKQRRTLANLEQFYATLARLRGGSRATGLAFARDLHDGMPLKQLILGALTSLGEQAATLFGDKYAPLFTPQHAIIYLAAWQRQAVPSEDKLVLHVVPKAAVEKSGEGVIVGVISGKRKGPLRGKVSTNVKLESSAKKKLQEGYDDVAENDVLAQVCKDVGYHVRFASAETGEK